MITLFSTHCPKCTQLEKRMQSKGLEYQIIDDVETMKGMGLRGSMPKIKTSEGDILEFADAWRYISMLEVK